MLTKDECRKRVAAEYPSFYVSGQIEYEGGLFFTIVPKGRSPVKALFDLHKVDRETGAVSGALPTMSFLQQPGAVEAVENARYLGIWAPWMNIRRYFIRHCLPEKERRPSAWNR